MMNANSAPGSDTDSKFPLWSGDIPGSKPDTDYVEQFVAADAEHAFSLVDRVSRPTLELFRPQNVSGLTAAVVICPGGGYQILADDHEGNRVGEWFAERGVMGVVLRYRLPSDRIMEDRSVGPLQDVQEAIRTVRRRADEWSVDPGEIGVMGFSAGGHLAATASTLYADKVYASDDLSARPDFSILVYPVISMADGITHEGSRQNLLGSDISESKRAHFSPDEQINAETPPAFLIHSVDDGAVPIENSLNYFNNLRAHGVPCELHAFPFGGHGYGLGISEVSPSHWPDSLEAWMVANGWMHAGD